MRKLLMAAAGAAAAVAGELAVGGGPSRGLPGVHRFRLVRYLSSGSSRLGSGFVSCAVNRPSGPNGIRTMHFSRPEQAEAESRLMQPQKFYPARGAHVARELSKDLKSSLQQLIQNLSRVGIVRDSWSIGVDNRILCPKCKGGSTAEKSLSVIIQEDGNAALWNCFRATCGWTGSAKSNGNPVETVEGKEEAFDAPDEVATSKGKQPRKIKEEELQLEPLCDELVGYFSDRMISRETLRRNGVMQRTCDEKVVIAFPYRREKILVSCKYREVSKKFWQERNTEKIFYGLDDIKGARDVIIVEGEIDKLSFEEAGYINCVSVPDGAPPRVSEKLPDEEKDIKYQFLWNCKDYLESASRIILATDADVPGQALAEELARRIGKERCWRVNWPKRRGGEVCKDANEVLMYLGREALARVIEEAELYPIRGLFRFSDFFNEIDAYYHGIHGFELGISTGWKSVDSVYKVVPGELTVISGVPNSGKSEWIDALLCNLNRQTGWSFILCSMENKVKDHARKLLEKHSQKPFFRASYGGSVERMNLEELELGKKWLDETFHLIRCEDDCLPSISWVLQLAKAAVLRYGARGLVIDPYNELDHQRPPSQTETEYVSQMLTKVKRFAQFHSCHVWFVAHPRQLQNWSGEPPNMYDISGSAHFVNKCDNGIVIHRNRDEKAGPLDRVQVCVRKVRNKVAGSIGDVFLSYNRITGEYMDAEDVTKQTARRHSKLAR